MKGQVSHLTCNVSCTMYHVTHVACCRSPVICHLSLMPKATDTDPPPANSPNMNSRITSESKLQRCRDIATYRLNRPQGRTALSTLSSTDSVICKQIPRPYQCRSQSDHAEDVYWVFSCVTEAE